MISKKEPELTIPRFGKNLETGTKEGGDGDGGGLCKFPNNHTTLVTYLWFTHGSTPHASRNNPSVERK
jgi:hypothetical protein